MTEVKQTLDISARRAFQEAASQGEWRNLSIGGAVKVAPAQNEAFQKALRHQMKVYTRRGRKKKFEDLDVDVQNQAWYEAMFETVVLDWKGILDGEVELEFTKKNYLTLMNEVWGFAADVLNEAALLEEFERDWQQEVEKNS